VKIPKSQAIELIDEKISQFQKVLAEATSNNRYRTETYELAYYGTEDLLKELFSDDEATNFRQRVSGIGFFIRGEEHPAQKLQDYKDHIHKCISQLKVYKERIQHFWLDEPSEKDADTGKVIQQKTVDSVTNLFDRGQFDVDIRGFFTRCLTEKLPLCLIMLDVDDFKPINDTYGHLKGDEVLKKIAEMAKFSVGEKGSVYRYGGEEFIVLLINFDSQEGSGVANRSKELEYRRY